MDIRENIVWSGTGHGLFDGVDYEHIPKREDDDQDSDKDPGSSSAFPEQNQGEQDNERNENWITAEPGHDPIQDGIAQRLVDKSKNGCVQCYEPRHSAKVSEGATRLPSRNTFQLVPLEGCF